MRLVDLSFGYERHRGLFDDLTVDVVPGERLALTGRSGCGKSTLLALMGLLLRPDRGRVVVLGTDATDLPDGARSTLRGREIGFVFQDAVLDPRRTVLDNVLEGAFWAGRDPREARREAADVLSRLGVDVTPTRRPGQVSGGQAQRIALARTIVGEPSIVLADEPTGNLDAESAQLVVAELSSLADAGVAVVLATHDDGLASWCDRRLEL